MGTNSTPKHAAQNTLSCPPSTTSSNTRPALGEPNHLCVNGGTVTRKKYDICRRKNTELGAVVGELATRLETATEMIHKLQEGGAAGEQQRGGLGGGPGGHLQVRTHVCEQRAAVCHTHV